MTITRTDQSDLVTAIHEGPFEASLWSSFLARVRRRLRADHAGLIVRRADATADDALELFASDPGMAGPDPRGIDRGRGLASEALRPGRVYTLDETIDAARPDDRRYRDEVLTPAGFVHARIVRVAERGGLDCWFVAARRTRDFAAADGALMAALAPHLAIALRAHATIERERFRSGIAEDAMRRLDFGWLTLAADGRVVDLDANAERMLRGTPALRHAHGRLAAAGGEADRTLAAALQRVADDPATRPRAIHLSDEPWLDLLLLPVRERVVSRGTTPVAVAYVHGGAGPSVHRVDQLRELLGLSSSEARLALALSRGRSIAEAAAELGLTIETARNYFKRIYQRTGARGQADLVRLILAGILALA